MNRDKDTEIHNACKHSLLRQGQPKHTPGRGGPTSVTGKEARNKKTQKISLAQGMQYMAEIPLYVLCRGRTNNQIVDRSVD